MKIANPGNIKLGDMRIIRRGHRAYTQEYVPGGWEYTQLHMNQTLTSCIAELIRRGFKYMGTEPGDTVYYYSKPSWVCSSCGEVSQEKIDVDSSVAYGVVLCYSCAKAVDDSYIEYCKNLE